MADDVGVGGGAVGPVGEQAVQVVSKGLGHGPAVADEYIVGLNEVLIVESIKSYRKMKLTTALGSTPSSLGVLFDMYSPGTERGMLILL